MASLGMPDPTRVKLNNRFVALTDMYMHAKINLYTSNSF